MLAQGYTAAVSSSRQSMIEFDRMTIDETETEEPSPLMKYVYGRYWVPFAVAIYHHFTAVAICPFKLVTETFMFEHKEYKMTIPRALERGSFDIITTTDTRGAKVHTIVTLTNSFMDDGGEDNTVYIVHSKYRSGMSSTNAAIIDSDGGALVKKWIDMLALNAAAENLVKLMSTPAIYIQKQPVSAYSDSAAEHARHDDLANPILQEYERKQGYALSSTVFMTHNQDINASLLPDGYMMSPNQPERPDSRLLEYYRNKDAEYRELVDLVMKMHHESIKSDTGGLHSRSEAAVEESKAATSAHLGEQVADITSAIRTVFGLIFSDRTDIVNVTIPCRSLATMELLWELYRNKMAPHKVVAEELGKMMNIDKSKLILEYEEGGGGEEEEEVDRGRFAVGGRRRRKRRKDSKQPILE